MNEHQRKVWYSQIVTKQHGEFCNGCGVAPLEWVMEPPYFINLLCRSVFITKKLFVEHIDNDPSHNILDNFQLLCRACNRIKNPVKLKTKSSREKTPEMERRDEREDKFRNYWVQRILADRFTEFDDLYFSGNPNKDANMPNVSYNEIFKVVGTTNHSIGRGGVYHHPRPTFAL